MASTNISSGNIEDLIFENRNKSYGAYDIRKKYGRYLRIGFGITVGLIVLILLYVYISAWIDAHKAEAPVEKIESIASLTEPPPTNKELPPPPEIKVPQIEQIKFVPPKIVEKVQHEEEIHTVEEVKQSTNVGSEDVKGDKVINTEPVKDIAPPVEDNSIHDLVDIQKQPGFPGGEEALQKYLVQNIRYPQQAAELNIQGKVYVQFVVEKDGSVTNAVVKKGIHPDVGCNDEALRVIKSMPRWAAGEQNGRGVRVYVVLPIKFVLK